MASLYNKFLDFIGIEESDEIEDEEEYDRGGRASRDYGHEREREPERRSSGRGNYRDEPAEELRGGNVMNFGAGGVRPSAAARKGDRASTPTGGNLPVSGGMKMIVYHPVSYEDTQIIIDNLKSRKPVIVNMEELDMDCAQRILDFLSGAVYALNGTMCKISRGIFVVAPNNYDVVGNNDDYNDMM